MLSATRRYDIDWLRVIAIGLLLIYHIAIAFQPWGVFIGFIQNSESLESVWIGMSMLNVWRIPFLFLVSGMGVAFAIQRRDWKGLIKERSLRILLPFIFGFLFIVPIHVFMWQDYYHQAFRHSLHPAHLWFLGNIFVYVLILSPVFFYLKKNKDGSVHRAIKKVLSHPAVFLLIPIPFIIESVGINPESYEYYTLNMHGFVLGMIAFLLGFCIVISGKKFWKNASKGKWGFLVIAFSLYLVRVLVFELQGVPYYLLSIETCLWIFTVLGIGYTYFNKPSKTLSYLSQAAYPIYIIHMIFIYLGSHLLFGLDLNPWVKLLGVNVITFGGCFIAYEYLIRRSNIIRPLFGLKITRKAPSLTKDIQEVKASS